MKTITENEARTVQLFEPDPGAIHTIEQVGHIAGISRRAILVYCKHGLLSPVIDPEYGGYYFDDEAIHTVRRIEYLHHTCGVNLEGIKMILHLVNEVERMRHELRFSRP
ncbi:MAG TPA: chaperone modulator CbpM [Verrucomicrobiae bacterium]|jgi:DNA-binding transcriptional MerR regulator|nr:chaperone modulator CbpM [Verrucomicrobiae bacterium]